MRVCRILGATIMSRATLSMVLAVLALPLSAAAQTTGSNERLILFASTGWGTTWDDEGLLGRGAAISGGIGVRLTPRLTIVGIVERLGYYRNVEWLTFDGRVVFGGAEAAFDWPGRVSLYVTVGAGVINDSGIWIQKTQLGPSQPPVETRVDRSGSRAGMTSSAGLAVQLSPRVSLRTGLRWHGLLQTGDDLFPHTVLQPTAGLAVRF
jgi:opacity protein-like surface antigen